jgi:hypothetical protein
MRSIIGMIVGMFLLGSLIVGYRNCSEIKDVEKGRGKTFPQEVGEGVKEIQKDFQKGYNKE